MLAPCGYGIPHAPNSASRLRMNRRLQQCREEGVAWKKWAPYLSERQWGTVREDVKEYYSYLS